MTDVPKGFKYTFVVQCKELINHAMTRIVATARIEGANNGEFMRALENLKCDPEIIKQIYIGDIDLETAPIMEKEKEDEVST